LSARVPFPCLIQAKTQSLSSTSIPGGGGRVGRLVVTRVLGVVAFLVRGVSVVVDVLIGSGLLVVVVVVVVEGFTVVEVGGGVGLDWIGVVGTGPGGPS
jgi:hypothetical protein